MPDSNSEYPGSSPRGTRRSGIVFTGMLLLVLLAVAFPEMPAQGLLGILWTGAGLLMVLFPPVVRVPRLWWLLAVGFVLFSLVGFLPRGWFHVPSWRTDLEALGLDTGPYGFVQPRLAAETVAGFAATAWVALFLLGHRIDSRCHQRLALGFALGVGAWTAVALIKHQPGGLFGFFPNRNHTATLLAMAAFAGLGSLAHAIRRKQPWKIAWSVVPTVLCLYALHAVSESRAGVVLIFAGFAGWILLTGFRHLQGNVGKALVLILIAASGYFLIVDSTVKKRLTSTVDQVVAPGPHAPGSPENPFAEGAVFRVDPSTDGRITIFQDTLAMILHEPWTGVGPGQFSLVFPQYRVKTNASNDARCLHPESDWLMMLSEVGWPATLCLLAGVVAVVITAVRQGRRGRARFLRLGCIVAALLLCLHGIFDVPGHRVGLAWAAALLLASSLRLPGSGSDDTAPGPSRLAGHAWRGLGAILALAGIYLIHARSTEQSVLPSVKVRRCMAEAKALYDQDQAAYDRAVAAGLDYQPEPSADPIEIALLKIKMAIDETPLDPYLHHVRGSLALHYDDKQTLAGQSFAVQRRLDPTRVNVALDQARAWSVQDPQQVLFLWREALRRASVEESRFPKSSTGIANTYQAALHTAGKVESLGAAALELAATDPSLSAMWARWATSGVLDREMPRLLAIPAAAGTRRPLFEIWWQRGSKDRAADFARTHPELNLE